MKRLFIGLKAGKKIEQSAHARPEDKKDWPVRWIKPENLHLTLAPPFYEKHLEALINKI